MGAGAIQHGDGTRRRMRRRALEAGFLGFFSRSRNSSLIAFSFPETPLPFFFFLLCVFFRYSESDIPQIAALCLFFRSTPPLPFLVLVLFTMSCQTSFGNSFFSLHLIIRILISSALLSGLQHLSGHHAHTPCSCSIFKPAIH